MESRPPICYASPWITMNRSDELLFEKRPPLAWVTYNRPQRRNAMTFAMYDRLEELCGELGEDPSVRVVLFRGAGDQAFVAGTEISQFQGFSSAQDAIGYEQRLERVFSKLESLQQATIALVQGVAAGGGAQLALVCDLCYCSPDSRFGVPIARTLGNCLSGSGYARLVERIGALRTRELLFTGRFIDAAEALSVGLVNAIYPKAELEEQVLSIAQGIARNAPLTIQVTKEALRRQLEKGRLHLEQDLFLRCYQSRDFREGVSAFLEKRKPHWEGK